MGLSIWDKVVFIRETRKIIKSGEIENSNGWFERCDNERWELFVDKCPLHAKKCEELPNWARNLLGVEDEKGRTDHSRAIPHAVSQAVKKRKVKDEDKRR